ncbi:MAG TPA: GNAT family N-acetyltransferase [Bacillota bacterium]|nr:GNAT family N-acetyltransferase [Bacillota bacterium]
MFLSTIDLHDEEIYLKLQGTAEADELKGFLPSYYFTIHRYEDDVELGRCDLRIGCNRNTEINGNLGYVIHTQYREHHYAGKACLLMMQLARKHHMQCLIITCRPENIASRKTCLYLGAEFQEIFELPEGHDLRQNGTKMCRYKVVL